MRVKIRETNSTPEPKRVPLMALFAIAKVAAAERPLVVVTARTALRARRGKVHRRNRG